MMTCKNCLYFNMCYVLADNPEEAEVESAETDCSSFADRSRYVVREKGEWGLEARSFYRDTFDESCELVVYIIANCTNCGEKHPNAHQVFSKTLYAPEDAEEDFRFNESLERMNALREFKAKGYKFAHFCPNCGADMRKGENG